MASLVGLSQPGYAKIESGITENVSLSLAIKISKALGVGFNELFDIDGDSQKIDSLKSDIETLKKRILGLEEQLNDKRQIIQFLSDNNFLKEIAWVIYCREYDKEHHREPFTYSDDDLLFDADNHIDREDFMKNYAEDFIKKYVEEGKKPPKGINDVS